MAFNNFHKKQNNNSNNNNDSTIYTDFQSPHFMSNSKLSQTKSYHDQYNFNFDQIIKHQSDYYQNLPVIYIYIFIIILYKIYTIIYSFSNYYINI